MIFLLQVLHTWPQQWLHPIHDRNCENPPGMPACFNKEKHIVILTYCKPGYSLF